MIASWRLNEQFIGDRSVGFLIGKIMMLCRACDRGYRRVEFRIDGRAQPGGNDQARRVREGVMRADRITRTGHVRDTVLLAILKDEWRV